MNEEHIGRVRRLCLALGGSSEKLSHGEPTFFVNRRVFAACSNDHHKDGHVAVLIPALPGEQELLIHTKPRRYYRPKYVGAAGWVGIELREIDDDELAGHLTDAWRLILEKTKPKKKAAR